MGLYLLWDLGSLAGFGVQNVPQCAGLGYLRVDDEEGVEFLVFVELGAQLVEGGPVVFNDIRYRDCYLRFSEPCLGAVVNCVLDQLACWFCEWCRGVGD